VTVQADSTRRPGLSSDSFNGRAAANADSPSAAEWGFVFTVLLAAAVIPGLTTKYGFPSQTVVQVFWSVAYVIAGRQLLMMRTQLLPLIRRYAPLWGLIMLMFVSTLWSVDSKTTMIDSIELLGTTLVGFYIATRFTLPEFLRIVAIMLATVSVLSLVIVFANPGYGRSNWGSGPWQGIFEDKNISGAMASLAIISQVVLLPMVKGRGRWLLVAGLLLSGLLLVEASSATAFGDCAFVVLAAFVAFACRSRRFGGFARFAAVLGLVIVIGSVFMFGLNIDTIYAMLGRSSDLTTRSDFWPYLQQAIGDRPLLGYGFDAFFQTSLARDYLQAFIVEAGGWMPYHAHNSFLQTELDVGYVGLGALISVLLISLRRAVIYFAQERRGIGIWPLAILLFLTIGSYTETYYLNYNSLEWILFVAAIVYARENRTVLVAATAPARKQNDRL
jgi:exopolysaccharide production protein ExoQ